jgi:cephalosporin hydroxylase
MFIRSNGHSPAWEPHATWTIDIEEGVLVYHPDDRASFRSHSDSQALAMGQDETLFSLGLELVHALDKYDYSYLWTWMGVPIIQFPADMIATQEAIWSSRPDVIIESGVARGGSVCFLASLQKLSGSGFVIGIDVDVRPHNLEAIMESPVADRIKLVNGSSTDPSTLEQVRSLIPPDARVMVILDSDHAKDHVLTECQTYGPLVTRGCYLVVADTLLGYVPAESAPTKRSQFLFQGNEPLSAVQEYLLETSDFVVDEALNAKLIMSSSPGGYLKCIRDG